jgi:hypothetical protein
MLVTYLRDKLDEKVYMNNSNSLEEFQENIRHGISSIPIQQLRHVSENILKMSGKLRIG